jgi:hypothetical protein
MLFSPACRYCTIVAISTKQVSVPVLVLTVEPWLSLSLKYTIDLSRGHSFCYIKSFLWLRKAKKLMLNEK